MSNIPVSANLMVASMITLLGMALVFATILFLWFAIELLMKLSVFRKSQAHQEEPLDEKERKRKAAASAVVVALARAEEDRLIHQVHEFPLPPTALVSAWQAVTRSAMHRKRGQIIK